MNGTVRLLLRAVIAVALTGSPAFAGFGQSVASFAAPAPRPIALAWADGNLYCFCETSPYLIWKIRPDNGKAIGSFKFAKTAADTAGLAYDGKYFWAGNRATEYIYRFEWGGRVASSFKAGWDFGQGLTWSGLHLWGTEKGSEWSHGYYQMRVDGKVIRSYTSAYELFDIAWDGSNLWAPEYDSVEKTYRVVGFKSSTGNLVGTFPAPANEAWGAAYDGTYLWLSTLADNGRLWKIDIAGVGVEPASLGRVKTLFR
jgi:hypothetical protein